MRQKLLVYQFYRILPARTVSPTGPWALRTTTIASTLVPADQTWIYIFPAVCHVLVSLLAEYLMDNEYNIKPSG